VARRARTPAVSGRGVNSSWYVGCGIGVVTNASEIWVSVSIQARDLETWELLAEEWWETSGYDTLYRQYKHYMAQPPGDVFFTCTLTASFSNVNQTVNMSKSATAPGECPDGREQLIGEYVSPHLWRPGCSDFYSSLPDFSPWTFSEWNSGNSYSWAAFQHNILYFTAELAGIFGWRPPIPTHGGYRTAAYQMTQHPDHPNGRHSYGDAVDLTILDGQEWELWKSYAKLPALGSACVEPRIYTSTWIHMDWRGGCYPGW
jgi:hypothetical protein